MITVGTYTKIGINTISLLISIIIIVCIENININKTQKEIIQKENIVQVTNNTSIEKLEKIETVKDLTWRLEISKIGLNAEISEGTDEKTLNEYIGHFENTNRVNGNIGLAAHNRGYPVNYFQNLKNLVIGDKVNYYYNGKKYIYEIYSLKIIDDTDWTVFDEQDFSTITLITCVENQPNFRRCIQGKLLN